MTAEERARRERELFAEWRMLTNRLVRVSRELGDLQMGQTPPARQVDNWIPPFLRKVPT